MRIIKNYKEDIYGNLATVYHRTNFSDLINAVYTEGFKPGEGDAYGKGFYGTYNLESQEREKMQHTYGNIVVKFAVSIEHFFIFDYSEFVKSPIYKKLKSTKETFLEDQVKYFNIKGRFPQYSRYVNKYSSDLARRFVYDTDILKKVKGIVFTGRNDGNTLVSYDTRILVPLAYRIDGEREFTKVDLNKDYFKKSLQQKLAPFDIGKDQKPEWLEKAKIKDAVFEYDYDDNQLVWTKGTWLNGTWEDGVWLNGTWEDGIWKRGGWSNGEWKNGTWSDGSFINGIWYNGDWLYGTWRGKTWQKGTWHNGYWKRGNWMDGVWKKGDWEKGTWEKGIWEDGEWWGGEWNGGTWLEGTWRGGMWNGGDWEGGIWLDGFWKNGVWKQGYWKKGIWKNGIWKNGSWEDGVWENGIWEDGEWLGGVWKGGKWIKGKIYIPKERRKVTSTVDPKTYFALYG